MEVDTPATQATSRISSASTVAHPLTQGGSAAQAPSTSDGPQPQQGRKTKKNATSQQGIRDIAAGVLEVQGMSREDWEQSLGLNYRVEPLILPEWSVSKPLGQHLSTVEGAPTDHWRTQTRDHLGSVASASDSLGPGHASGL